VTPKKPPAAKVAGDSPDKTKPASRTGRAIGIAILNDDGTMSIVPATFTPAKPIGGRPRKVGRDVSLLLHFEYLTTLEKMPRANAHRMLAGMFKIMDESKIPGLLQKTLDRYVKEFRSVLFSQGTKDAKGVVNGRVLVIFEEVDAVRKVATPAGNLWRIDGQGFITSWGVCEAHYGRLTGESK